MINEFIPVTLLRHFRRISEVLYYFGDDFMSEEMQKLKKLVPFWAKYKVEAYSELYGSYLSKMHINCYISVVCVLLLEIFFSGVEILTEYLNNGNWIFAILMFVITIILNICMLGWSIDPSENKAVFIWYILDCLFYILDFDIIHGIISGVLAILIGIISFAKIPKVSKEVRKATLREYKLKSRKE